MTLRSRDIRLFPTNFHARLLIAPGDVDGSGYDDRNGAMVPDFDHINAHLPGAALKATRNAALLPADISFHKTMDQDFAQDLDEFSSKVLSITNRLLELSSTIDSAGKGKAKLESQDDVLDSFESCVVDRIDLLLERVVSHNPQITVIC